MYMPLTGRAARARDPAFQGHEAAPRRRWWACACLGGSSPADELDFDGEAAFRKAIALHGEHRSDNRATPPTLMARQPALRACRARTLYGAVLQRAARVIG